MEKIGVDLIKNKNSINPILTRYATHKNRWYALVIIALGLAIVIIDNTILNVSIPYMLRDLNSTFSDLQWAVSGYALTIASILITVGRIGDLLGRKKMFLIGVIIFALGSFIASISSDAAVLIIGRAIIQAVGAAIMLTSALSLLAAEFQGKERAIAFGIWGAIAGASSTIGPLLGGFLTTNFSWRWSLRINLIVAVITILGSLFIIESKGIQEKRFDWLGTILSGLGFFCVIFGFIEGRSFGWITPNEQFSVLGLSWPFSNISIIPIFFTVGILLLILFFLHERSIEKKGGAPILSPGLFLKRGFVVGILMLSMLSFGLFSLFFNLPIYIENVLGYDAFSTGIVFLSATISIFIMATLTGFLATKIQIKWIIVGGMIFLALGYFFLIPSITLTANAISLAPALILFGVGFGLSSAQLNNVIISSASLDVAGEAAATSITMRQIGSAIGIAVISTILVSSLSSNFAININNDPLIPEAEKPVIIEKLNHTDIESGQISFINNSSSNVRRAIENDVDRAIVTSMKTSMRFVFYILIVVIIISLFLPRDISADNHTRKSNEKGRNN